jgi:hypothetical protein
MADGWGIGVNWFGIERVEIRDRSLRIRKEDKQVDGKREFGWFDGKFKLVNVICGCHL